MPGNGGGTVGPHEGRELELMIDGSKPLSMFVIESTDPGWTEFPEKKFDEQVAAERFKKYVHITQAEIPGGGFIEIRTVYYSLIEEEWRIRAFVFIDNLYKALGPGYRSDLERIIGGLLGYSVDDVEHFLDRLRDKGAKFAS